MYNKYPEYAMENSNFNFRNRKSDSSILPRTYAAIINDPIGNKDYYSTA